jgi:periplasmic protein TonB
LTPCELIFIIGSGDKKFLNKCFSNEKEKRTGLGVKHNFERRVIMTTLGINGRNFPVINGLAAALIITGMLLIFCTQLIKLNPAQPAKEYKPVIIEFQKPPEPLDPVEEEVITPKPINATNVTPPDRVPYETVMPDLNNVIKTEGTIPIPVVKPVEYVKTIPRVKEIFDLTQVDRRPRVLRPVTPVYPTDALRNGIEGRVILRFIVDENGQVQNPEVLKAEPAGVFEEAALAAIVKYRFAPAVVNDKNVKCFAILPIGFRLN